MKINQTDGILKSLYSKPAPKTDKTGGIQFANILKRALGPPHQADTQTQTHHLAKSAPVHRIQPLEAMAAGKRTLVDRVDTFLDLLDEYRQMLGNMQVSLNAMEPVLKRLETENQNLQPLLEALPDGDHMKGILNEALITASLEVEKYRRGDYRNPGT